MDIDPPLAAPLSTTINITESCQLNCLYCYARTNENEPVHMPSAMAIAQIKELHDLGVWKIVIGGGEPFLHPDWHKIFTEVLLSGIKVAIISNGIAVADNLDKIGKLFETNPGRISLQISVDGPTPEIHNRSRGRGEDVFRSVRLMKEANLPVQLATVVTKHNIDSAHEIIDVFYPAVKRYHFMNLMPSRKAFDKIDDLGVDRIASNLLWSKLNQKRKELKDIYLSTPSCEEEEYAEASTMLCPGCTAGFSRMDINANGDIVACHMAYKSVMGNLHENNFKEIWFSDKADSFRRFDQPLCFQADLQ